MVVSVDVARAGCHHEAAYRSEDIAVRTFLTLGLVVLVSGCLVETVVSTGVQAENAANAATAADAAKTHSMSALDKTKTQNAVNTYEAENGSYPASLNELVPDYLSQVPDVSYDPVTGKVN